MVRYDLSRFDLHFWFSAIHDRRDHDPKKRAVIQGRVYSYTHVSRVEEGHPREEHEYYIKKLSPDIKYLGVGRSILGIIK